MLNGGEDDATSNAHSPHAATELADSPGGICQRACGGQRRRSRLAIIRSILHREFCLAHPQASGSRMQAEGLD